ncbi:hypothetical protein EfmAA242_20800 [Enterococcus faecium]|nr:hypothetical protein EfmAA242_20800 [Enterococcus faecium]
MNGYLLTGILVGIIILLPIFGIKDMNELVKWLTNLNSFLFKKLKTFFILPEIEESNELTASDRSAFLLPVFNT